MAGCESWLTICASRKNCFCSVGAPNECTSVFRATVRPRTVSRALSTRLVAPHPKFPITSYRFFDSVGSYDILAAIILSREISPDWSRIATVLRHTVALLLGQYSRLKTLRGMARSYRCVQTGVLQRSL